MKNRYFKGSRLSEAKFRLLCKYSAFQAARLAGVNRNTAQSIYGKLRERVDVLADIETEEIIGEIEIDEAYFGPIRVRGKRGRGAGKKIPVIGILQRDGRVFVQAMKDCSSKRIWPVIKENVSFDATVYTDGFTVYDHVLVGFDKHHKVKHHINEFARGRYHINGIESFWSYAKHSIRKRNGVRKKHFPSHLKEIRRRYNHRHKNAYLALLKNLRKNPLN